MFYDICWSSLCSPFRPSLLRGHSLRTSCILLLKSPSDLSCSDSDKTFEKANIRLMGKRLCNLIFVMKTLIFFTAYKHYYDSLAKIN